MEFLRTFCVCFFCVCGLQAVAYVFVLNCSWLLNNALRLKWSVQLYAANCDLPSQSTRSTSVVHTMYRWKNSRDRYFNLSYHKNQRFIVFWNDQVSRPRFWIYFQCFWVNHHHVISHRVTFLCFRNVCFPNMRRKRVLSVPRIRHGLVFWVVSIGKQLTEAIGCFTP